MEERKLLLLGLLLSQSQHGYQINDFIEKNLSEFVEIKRSTAYSTLDNLCSTGYVNVEMEQMGNRPPRKVYTLTDEGRQLFDELLEEYLVKLEGFPMPIETALMYIDSLPREKQVELLEERLASLRQSILGIEATPSHGTVSGVDMAVSHRLCTMRAEEKWLTEQLEQLKQLRADPARPVHPS